MLQHRYAQVNGIRIHYVEDGHGSLIIFLHGFPEFWYEWKNQLSEFARDYRVVAPDMRGYNLSDKPAELEPYQPKYLVEDVRALADQLAADKFILVGHDWGGVVGWLLALTYPERIRKLVIVNAPHPVIFQRELRQHEAQQQASRYMLLFRSPQAEQILAEDNYRRMRNMLTQYGLERGFFDEDDQRAYLEAWSQPGALTGGLNYYRAARLGPFSGDESNNQLTDSARVPVINVPTLVIWGEKDTALLTGNLDGLEQFVSELSIQRVPDGTHWVIHEYPALVNQYIRAFIESPS